MKVICNGKMRVEEAVPCLRPSALGEERLIKWLELILVPHLNPLVVYEEWIDTKGSETVDWSFTVTPTQTRFGLSVTRKLSTSELQTTLYSPKGDAIGTYLTSPSYTLEKQRQERLRAL